MIVRRRWLAKDEIDIAIVLNKSGFTYTNEHYKLLQLSVNQNEQGCRIAMSTFNMSETEWNYFRACGRIE